MCTPIFIVALSTVAKIWKQHSVHQMGKLLDIHVYRMESYSAIKKEILPLQQHG